MTRRSVECLNDQAFYKMTKIHGCTNKLRISSQRMLGLMSMYWNATSIGLQIQMNLISRCLRFVLLINKFHPNS